MDDVRIYNRALSALEIDTLYKHDGQCVTSKTPDGLGNSSSQSFHLSQNYPNPFTSHTNIDYTLPSGMTKGELKISDMFGRQVLQLPINDHSGTLQVPAAVLQSGFYFYTLYTEGNMLETKKMFLSAQ